MNFQSFQHRKGAKCIIPRARTSGDLFVAYTGVVIAFQSENRAHRLSDDVSNGWDNQNKSRQAYIQAYNSATISIQVRQFLIRVGEWMLFTADPPSASV